MTNNGNNIINIGIDYNLFMLMLKHAFGLEDNMYYHEALWDYFSMQEEIPDGKLFFDNLFQGTKFYYNLEDLFNDYPQLEEYVVKDKEGYIFVYATVKKINSYWDNTLFHAENNGGYLVILN